MVKGFNSKAQIGCSICCMLSLFMALIATILIHVAFNALIEPLVKLPQNLLTGINDVLHFATLKTDAASVAAQAQATLQKCGVNVGQCPSPPSSNRTSNTAAELAGIQAIFKSTLASVEKTANDKYLGIGDFQKAGADLKAIHAKMDEAAKIQQPTPCDVTDPLYCSIYTASIAAQSAAAQVQQGVDKITNSKEVKEFKNQTKNVKTGLNVLPYLFWLSTLFYVCFFFSKRPSCRGGAAPCCACTWHTIFFVISIILCIVFVVIGLVVMRVSKDVTLKDPFQGSPTIVQLVDHIEVTFPRFYDKVFKDLIGGLKKTWDAWVVFLVAHIILSAHACGCCCGVYIDTPKESS
mmetsp:Transcript_141419/g.439539  ORF Transcript_141419/g.439539 Transcript_141419/m.439539 type:complete len:350 (-) Transcript_141419:168-1217(-)